jgi:poly-gamma-glutamate biosynthesis protein PgsC/CapC
MIVVEAVGLGLVVSLIFSEAIGLAAGGMVVPGYVALYLNQPLRILGTVIAALATYLTLRFISHFVILYGRRCLVISVVLGFFYGVLTRFLMVEMPAPELAQLVAVGYIVPGLLAYWMERQGIIATLCVMIMAAVPVRLGLIILRGGELLQDVPR